MPDANVPEAKRSISPADGMMSDWGTHTRPGLGEKMHSR